MTFDTRFASTAALSISLLVSIGVLPAIGDEIATRKSVTEELLDILLDAGMIDDTQYESLARRAREEERQRLEAAVEKATAAAVAVDAIAPADAVAPIEDPKPDGWDFRWDTGFNLTSPDGAFDLEFGGRIHNDWAYIDADDEIDVALGSDGHGTEIRRARIYFQGTLWENLFFKSQLEFGTSHDGTVSLKDMFVGMRNLGPLGSVTIGQMKEPFSLEQQMSSNVDTFMERSIAEVFAPIRSVGIQIVNSAFDGRLLWQLGVFEATNPSGFSFSEDEDWRVTGRIVAVPVYENGGERVVHLGVTYSHRFHDRNLMQQFRVRPDSHLAPYFADTGLAIPADDTDILLAEWAFVWGPAAMQGSYSQAFVDSYIGGDLDFWGIYAQASYFLTGERKNYRLGSGQFGRTVPKLRFNPAIGNWGAWEIAARFGYVDLNDGMIRGGRLWSVTAGLNWYLYPNTRVMLNYVHSNLRDRTVLGTPVLLDVDGDSDIAEMRFQLEF